MECSHFIGQVLRPTEGKQGARLRLELECSSVSEIVASSLERVTVYGLLPVYTSPVSPRQGKAWKEDSEESKGLPDVLTVLS